MVQLKRIAIVGTTADSIVNFRGDLIVALVNLGYEVFAFATDYSSVEKSWLEKRGAKAVDYNLSRAGLNPLRDLLDMLSLAKLLKKLKPDLVFSYFSKPVIFATIAAKLAGVPRKVGMLEGLGFSFTQQPDGVSFKASVIKYLQIFLYRISFLFLDRIVFLNADDYEDLVVAKRVKVKNHSVLGGIGLNLSQYPFSLPPTMPVRFIFIGRLLVEKGVMEYIAACERLKFQYPDVECVVLGGADFNSPERVGKEIKRLRELGVLLCPGHVSNVPEWLAGSSVFVLPSYREGFPRSTQEAMAIGRPVITTNVPGCKDTVVDGLNGFVVPPWSSEAILQKMIYFVENPNVIERMGQESHNIAHEKFDSVAVNNRLIGFMVGGND